MKYYYITYLVDMGNGRENIGCCVHDTFNENGEFYIGRASVTIGDELKKHYPKIISCPVILSWTEINKDQFDEYNSRLGG